MTSASEAGPDPAGQDQSGPAHCDPVADAAPRSVEHIVDEVDMARIARLAVSAVLGVVAIGAIGGLIWGAVAPGVTGVVVAVDKAGSLGADTGHRFDAIAIFACISFVAGVLGGVGTWWIRPLRGPAGAVSVALGALLGAAAGAWLGGLVAGARHPGPANTAVGQYFQTAPSLRLGGATLDTIGGINLSWAIVVVAPIGALLAYLVLLLAVRRPDLGVVLSSRWGTQGGELVGDPQAVLGEAVEGGRAAT